MTFGAKIQKLRESRGLTQKMLAEITCVSTGKVAEWEADEVAPDIMELAKLSKALSVSSDELLEPVGNSSAKTGAGVQLTCEEAPSSRKGSKTVKGLWIVAACLLLAIVAVMIIDQIPQKQEEIIPFSQDTAAIEKADASVVTIFCYDYEGELAATGSGFIAFNGKTVVTNYHVMTSAYTCKISTNKNVLYNVDGIQCFSKEQDIAILRLEKDTGLTPLTLGKSSTVKKGEVVVAIGSPLGIRNTVSGGILSGRRTEGNMNVLQFTAPISQGSSGGALFDDFGTVIGITYAFYIDGQNINLAIPIEAAQALFRSKDTLKVVYAICIEEYPYIRYLDEYKNVPVVTLSELKLNPEKYDGKLIRMSAFVSSRGKEDTKYWWDDGIWHLSDENYISLDYKYDAFLASPFESGVEFGKCPIIECMAYAEDEKYIDDSVQAGDKIEIVAHFNFHSKGELNEISPELGSYPHDDGYLNAVLIWKSK